MLGMQEKKKDVSEHLRRVRELALRRTGLCGSIRTSVDCALKTRSIWDHIKQQRTDLRGSCEYATCRVSEGDPMHFEKEK